MTAGWSDGVMEIGGFFEPSGCWFYGVDAASSRVVFFGGKRQGCRFYGALFRRGRGFRQLARLPGEEMPLAFFLAPYAEVGEEHLGGAIGFGHLDAGASAHERDPRGGESEVA